MLTCDSNHRYFKDGVRVPGTTELCAILAPRWQVEEYFLHKGDLIHLLTDYEDQKVLDEDSVDPLLAGYLKGYREFKMVTGFRPTKIEYQFYSRKWGYCGRVDKYGVLFDYLSVLDVKSGAPHEADQYQAPAYLFGLKDNGLPCWRAWDLYLKANGSYRLVEVKKPTALFQKFLTAIPKWIEENK